MSIMDMFLEGLKSKPNKRSKSTKATKSKKTTKSTKSTKTNKPKKTIIYEFEGIPYEVVRRRVKYSRVEFKPDRLKVIVPRGVKPLQVLEENRQSIISKYNRLRDQINEAQETPLVYRTEQDFFDLVNHFMAEYCYTLGVPVPTIKYRRMKRRWGSCRSDGIITMNRHLQHVPKHLIGYIVFHEVAHFLERGHNAHFKAIIVTQYPNYRQLDQELNLYGLKLL